MNADQRTVKDPIPQFTTREEEADFWDTHDFTDYWDEFKPVKVVAGPNLTSSFRVPLGGKALTQICQYADANGLDVETLLSTWIMERLQEVNSRAGT